MQRPAMAAARRRNEARVAGIEGGGRRALGGRRWACGPALARQRSGAPGRTRVTPWLGAGSGGSFVQPDQTCPARREEEELG